MTARCATRGQPAGPAGAGTPLRDAGLAYASLYFAEAAYDRAGLERFMREVAPAL